MKKVKDPVIAVNSESVLVNGSIVEVKMGLVHILDSFRQKDILTKDEMHEIVDMVYMSEEELDKLAKKKLIDLYKSLRKVYKKDE